MDKNPIVPALERGFDLLEWITTQNEPVTLTQIAQGMNLSVSEMQRTVACVLARGYILRSAAGTYSLSGKLYQLAQTFPPYLQIQQAALPPMLDFARATEQSVHISVPDGDHAMLLADVPGSGLVRISLQPGARLDPAETVSGRILLAFGALTEKPSRGRALLTKLSAIRRNGYEQAESSYAKGIVDLGVPVENRSGQAVAALTAPILQLRNPSKSTEALVDALQACAKRIGLSL